MSNKSYGRPERPVDPYSWNPERMSEEMLEDWYGYIRALEDYTEYLEAMAGLDGKAKAASEPPKKAKLYEICYHEILGKTIYVKAGNDDEARTKAEAYFQKNPLSYDDYIDSSMETLEIDQKTSGIEDWEITITEDERC